MLMQDRKKDHIELTELARVSQQELDNRFYYEPLLAALPEENRDLSIDFLEKKMSAPIWISSMTGGTKSARKINENLARAVEEFGLGMGLGSSRVLLDSPEFYRDFDLRSILGKDRPFYANFGIAQIEKLLELGEEKRIGDIVEKLDTDGVIVHINPLQEWMQPEGDVINHPPIDTMQRFLEKVDYPVVVKEVGQGMGPESLRALMKLPLAAIEFGAAGGTNFSKMEWLRRLSDDKLFFDRVAFIGHTATEMTDWVNEILESEKKDILCRQFIISGGIKDFLDGYYFIHKTKASAVYGMASTVLKYAKEDYATLRYFLQQQLRGLRMASALLRVKTSRDI